MTAAGMTAAAADDRPGSDPGGLLRVGSWPGPAGAGQNQFIRLFLDGLASAGCTIVALDEVAAIGRRRDLDILILHWPERVFREAPGRIAALRKLRALPRLLDGRAPGTKVVWLAHNLEPHDARPLQRLLWAPFMRALTARVDAVLTLAPGTLAPVLAAFPALGPKPAHAAWHPAYPGAAVSEAERLALRRARGWDEKVRVLGYCGQVRRYKGVDTLLAAFRRTTDPALRLLVAGQPWRAGPLIGDLEAAAAADARIALDLRDLPEADFRAALGSADVVVAPFRRYLHSGSLIHALSAARPVLTPATPFAESLQTALGPDWVRTWRGPLTAARLAAGAAPRPAGAPPMAAFAAAAVGADVAVWLRTLADNR